MKLSELTESDLLAQCSGAGLTWRIHPFVIRVKTRLADVARGLAFLYAEFPLVEQDAVADAELIVRRKPPWPGWVSIRVDGTIRGKARKEAMARIAQSGPLLVMTTPETLAGEELRLAL